MSTTLPTYDLVILGGGPAGYSAAIKAAQQGFKVCIIEKDKMGGACINRGCIPTKALWGTAVNLQRLKDLKEHGILTSGEYRFDFAVAAKRQFGIIDQMVQTVQKRVESLNVVIACGDGKIAEKNAGGFVVECQPKTGSATKLQTRFVLVATGSRPAESDILISDRKTVLTTDEFTLLQSLPKSLAIVGGGVVACEFASIMHKFGVKVHLLEHSSQILSSMDQEVVAMLTGYMQEDGVDIRTNTKVAGIDKVEPAPTAGAHSNVSSARLKLSNGDTLEVEKVLLAIGRKPNSEKLGLETLGVKLTPRGHIIANDFLETDCKGIFAAGDVVGGQMLAHKAWYDSSIAIRRMCGEECKADYNTVPGAIFTIPEMASVGMQPDQARQKGYRIAIGKFPYSQNAQALCTGKTRGMVKAVIDRDTDKILGCTIIGHDASNLISEVALAMSSNLTVKDLTNTIHPHPTLSELLWEAFLDTQGLSIHKS